MMKRNVVDDLRVNNVMDLSQDINMSSVVL